MVSFVAEFLCLSFSLLSVGLRKLSGSVCLIDRLTKVVSESSPVSMAGHHSANIHSGGILATGLMPVSATAANRGWVSENAAT